MADDREPLGRIAWETFVAWACEQPGMAVRRDRWEDLSDEEREMSMRIGSAVAAEAVRDAGLGNERMKAQMFALTAHRPAIFDALNIILRMPELYESQKKRYRAALKALGGVEEDGSDA
jgi:hypothetical protein